MPGRVQSWPNSAACWSPGRCGDGNRDGKGRGMGFAVDLAGGAYLREDRPGNFQYVQELLIPVARMDIVKHRPGGVRAVGDVPGAAGEVPDQPGVDSPEGEPPFLRHPPGTGYMIEDPGDLGPGEIGVRNKARLLPNERPQPRRLQAVAVGRGAAVLPDDGVMDRPARGALPDHRRLPLIGYAEGSDVGGTQASFPNGLPRHAGLGFPNLQGIVLHPAGLGVVLAGTPSGPRRRSSPRHRRRSPGNWSCPDQGPRERPWIPPLKMRPALRTAAAAAAMNGRI